MEMGKCGGCGVGIRLPTGDWDEFKATGVFCQCLKFPLCLKCNLRMVEVHRINSNGCCAFGYPKKVDYFYPGGVVNEKGKGGYQVGGDD